METQKPEQVLPLGQIIQGDNVEVLKTFPDNCIDLTVTSPPYDVFDENWQVIDGQRKYKGYSWSFPELAKQLYRVTKDGGVVVWVVNDQTLDGNESLTSFRQALHFQSIGFNVHDTMIYKKDMRYPDKTRYSQVFEFMFVLSKGKPKTINLIKDKKNRWAGATAGDNNRQVDGSIKKNPRIEIQPFGARENIWYYSSGYMKTTKDVVAYEHPAIYPEELAEDHIKSWSNEGDIILDPFAGSGTTLKAAEKLMRRWVGIEIAPEYIKIAEKRLEPYRNQTRL